MSTAPVIQYLQLDPSYDPIFDPTANLTNLDAVTQSISTRLNLFLGEWWSDLSLGLPVFQSILGQLGSPQGLSAMELAVHQNIEGTPYVTTVDNVALDFTAGRFSIIYAAQTAFGPIVSTVSAPCLSADLTG